MILRMARTTACHDYQPTLYLLETPARYPVVLALLVGRSDVSRSKKHTSFLCTGINGGPSNQLWLMSWSTQCLPIRLRVRTQIIESSLPPRFVQQSSGPNLLGLQANIISILQHVPMLDCCPLCRYGAFPFATYPQSPGLTNRSRLVKLCLSLQNDYDKVALIVRALYPKRFAQHKRKEERFTHH